jgi:hypothetical protein
MLKKVALITAALTFAGVAAHATEWVDTHKQTKAAQVQGVKKSDKGSKTVQPASKTPAAKTPGEKALNPQPLPPG